MTIEISRHQMNIEISCQIQFKGKEQMTIEISRQRTNDYRNFKAENK